MTIRDYLKRRVRGFFALAITGWLISAASMFLITGNSSPCRPSCATHGTPLPLLIGFPIFIVAIIGLTFFTKCPRCNGRLGQFAATLVTRGSLFRSINFCPYCGVNLDENCSKP